MFLLSALATLSTASAAGDGVLYYTGHSGFSVSSYFPPSDFEDVIVNEECGTFTETGSWPADLSVYRMVVLMIPSSSWSTAETQQIQDFIDDDGVLVAVGDSSGYDSAHVSPMNTLLGNLGVTSTLQNTRIDSGCSGNTAAAATTHALTEGISSTGIQYGWSSDITIGSGGTELFTGNSGQALGAVEGQVVLISDINVFIDDCNLNSDSRQFFANLYHYGTSANSCDMDVDGYDAEHCGGADCNDCDSGTDVGDDWYADDDGDSYGDASSTTAACSLPSGYVADATDCDDTDSAINPAATETCDGEDNDCDGDIDESGSTYTYYADDDGDGYGDPGVAVSGCSEPSGYVSNNADCDDTDGSVYPNALELCNGLDNDCDGTADNDYAADALTWYADSDGDSYGDVSSTTDACDEPSGYVADDDDCDDTDAAIHPSATEVCDGDDNDCDGLTDEGDAADTATWYADDDGDNYGDASSTFYACDEPSGYVADDTDCDDTDSAINPAATEVCDGDDNDCDGTADNDDAADSLTWFADDDGDTYGDASSTTDACDEPSGFVSDDTDCDDTDSAIHPAATEVCDGDDNDCDGTIDNDDAVDALTWYEDNDGDVYGNLSSTTDACDQPTGYVSDDNDCDDTDAAVNPAATEVCDGDDNDCDGTIDNDDAADSLTWFADTDGDTYGDSSSTTEACAEPTGYVSDDTDCDDTDSAINPAATEVCDGDDNDCDGTTDNDDAADSLTWFADTDGDIYGDATSTTDAC
ncbi:MAG: hypothetical protein ACI8RZ_000206, partial [Myxococcota bacterium]